MKDFIEMARQHNASIDAYMKELEEEYGERVPVAKWFEINQKIREQRFWDKGLPIVHEAQAHGIDLKINGQDNRICYKGMYEF